MANSATFVRLWGIPKARLLIAKEPFCYMQQPQSDRPQFFKVLEYIDANLDMINLVQNPELESKTPRLDYAPENTIILEGVSWSTFQALLAEVGEN